MIHVNNLGDEGALPADLAALLEALARAVLIRAGRAEAEVGITLADDDYLRALNKRYRGVDAPTDVLSFGFDEPAGGEAGPDLLGDVFISLPRAADQAREYGHGFRREVAFLAVHGLLHLLGYDHDQPGREEAMLAEAEAILAEKGIGRI